MPIIIIIIGKIISSSNRSTRYSRIVSVTVLVTIEILLFAVLVVLVLMVACRVTITAYTQVTQWQYRTLS